MDAGTNGSKRRWRPWERERLSLQISQGACLNQIQIHGRTKNAIHAQAVRQGLITAGSPRENWPLRQIESLKDAHRSRYTVAHILVLDLLGPPFRSQWAIRKMLGRLHLTNPKRSAAGRRKKIWKAGELEKFHIYLVQRSDGETPEQIARIWKVSRGTVIRHQILLNMRPTRSQVVQMPYSQAKFRRAFRKNRKKLQKHLDQFRSVQRQARELRLSRLAAMLRERTPPLPEKTCRVCKRSWPLQEQFFPIRWRLTQAQGKVQRFSGRCRLCRTCRHAKRAQRNGAYTKV